MFGKNSSSITIEEILKRVRECDILAYYLGIIKIPCVINSPLRIDTHPSFSIFYGKDNKIKFKDFVTQETGGTFDLLMKMWNISLSETLNKIENNLSNFNKGAVHIINTDSKTHTYSKEVELQCKVRDWKKYDLLYWESMGISLPWLKFGDIYPISHTIIKKQNQTFIIPCESYAYAYVEFKDGIESLKIYQPFSKQYKWINKHDSSVWDLWTKLPKEGDKLIINSSRKDALCVWSNTGIPCVALQAESYLPKPHVIQQLKDRFKNVFILYDNDFKSEINWGREYGKKLSNEFGLKQIEIPSIYKSKDPSDLCHNYNRGTLHKVITSLIE